MTWGRSHLQEPAWQIIARSMTMDWLISVNGRGTTISELCPMTAPHLSRKRKVADSSYQNPLH